MSKRCKETTYTTTHTMTRRLQPLRTRIAISEGVMVCCDKCSLSRPHERATWTSYTTKHDDLALQRTRRYSEAQARDCLSASPHASALSVPWVGLGWCCQLTLLKEHHHAHPLPLSPSRPQRLQLLYRRASSCPSCPFCAYDGTTRLM